MTTDYDTQILSALRGPGGLTTGDVAAKCRPIFSRNNRMHAALIRQILLKLQEAGKVQPMDDQKPVCWVLMEKQP